MTLLAQFAATGGALANYIEDVFSTYLWTGTGANRTITNGIDLSTNGGLVWIKSRNFADNHNLFDTTRGVTNRLFSNLTNAQSAAATSLTAFTSSGFSLGSNSAVNADEFLYASWTFREQEKFFDIVTYTGTGVARTVAHNLGSVPGCIIVKRTDTAGFDWLVYHRSTGNTNRLLLNDTAAAASGTSFWNDTTPTSTVFTVGTNVNGNASGGTYVAYLFAHDAGGFGLTGSDNVISCGSVVGAGNPTEVTLGYEPQWLLIKNASNVQDWWLLDNMRGLIVENASSSKRLNANTTAAETGLNVRPTATGFINGVMTVGESYIYIAVRRGPMKVPTTGTSVFSPVARTGTATTASVTAGFPVDMYLMQRRPSASFPNIVDRLRGNTKNIQTYQTDAETTTTDTVTGFDNMTAAIVGADTAGYVNTSGITFANQMFRRAPGFFDVVCYTGTGVNRTVSHNLAAVPELMIVKGRSIAERWSVYSAPTTATAFLILDGTTAASTNNFFWNDTTPTSSVFTVGTQARVNNSGDTYVAYLFATCAGVSKVGSYTGTGTTQTINCGFTAGSRFVMIKRTDNTGDWYVWDSARGIIAGNDPYLLLNSTAAEVTGTDYVDTAATGFELSSTAPAAINASGGSYIFLAIA
jgi:hypothetical protein